MAHDATDTCTTHAGLAQTSFILLLRAANHRKMLTTTKTERQTNSKTFRQTHRQIQTDRQAGKQRDRHKTGREDISLSVTGAHL